MEKNLVVIIVKKIVEKIVEKTRRNYRGKKRGKISSLLPWKKSCRYYRGISRRYYRGKNLVVTTVESNSYLRRA